MENNKNVNQVCLSNERETSFDLLRILCCFFVILIHESAIYVQDIEMCPIHFHMNSWMWGNICDSLGRSCIPLFVMLSGAFMLDPRRTVGFDKVFRKSLHLLLVCCFWFVVYFIFNNFRQLFLQNDITVSIKVIIESFLYDSFHLWFFFLIIGLYLLVPIIRLIVRDTIITRYFLVLSAAVTFIVPVLLNIASCPDLNTIWSKADLSLVTGYSFYFVMGFELRRIFKEKRVQKKTVLLSIVVFCLSWCFCVYYTWIDNKGQDYLEQTLYLNMSITTLLESVSLFIIFGWIGQNIALPDCISKLAKYTMGIYLSHVLGLLVIDDIVIRYRIECYPIIMIVGVTIVDFIGCLLLSYFMSKVRIFRRLILQ